VTGADPISWLMIRPGWKVVARDGSELGEVDEVAGDENVDIFNGLSVTTDLFDEPRYVPSEEVDAIVDGEVRLSLTKEQFEAQPEYLEPPPSLQISPEKASISDRVVEDLEALAEPDWKPQRVTWWRRLRRRLIGRR
jgi:hypothetical protein